MAEETFKDKFERQLLTEGTGLTNSESILALIANELFELNRKLERIANSLKK